MSWKKLKIEGISQIEKCVSEFEVSALDFFETIYLDQKIEYGTFKVKIYENQQDTNNFYYTGYTNIRLRTLEGGYEGGIGFGTTIDETLENTIYNFMNNIKLYKKSKGLGLVLEDFVLLSYDEF